MATIAATLAMAPAATLAAPSPAAPTASPIMQAMRRLAELDRQTIVVDKAAIASGVDAKAEMDRLYDRIDAIRLEVLAASPTSMPEAVLILMMAVWEIDGGTAFEDALDMVDRGNAAANRCCRFLANHADIDLAEFGGERILVPVSA